MNWLEAEPKTDFAAVASSQFGRAARRSAPGASDAAWPSATGGTRVLVSGGGFAESRAEESGVRGGEAVDRDSTPRRSPFVAQGRRRRRAARARRRTRERLSGPRAARRAPRPNSARRRRSPTLPGARWSRSPGQDCHGRAWPRGRGSALRFLHREARTASLPRGVWLCGSEVDDSPAPAHALEPPRCSRSFLRNVHRHEGVGHFNVPS